jgi:hypothetical protein
MEAAMRVTLRSPLEALLTRSSLAQLAMLVGCIDPDVILAELRRRGARTGWLADDTSWTAP